jgi:hypothetical protein
VYTLISEEVSEAFGAIAIDPEGPFRPWRRTIRHGRVNVRVHKPLGCSSGKLVHEAMYRDVQKVSHGLLRRDWSLV